MCLFKSLQNPAGPETIRNQDPCVYLFMTVPLNQETNHHEMNAIRRWKQCTRKIANAWNDIMASSQTHANTTCSVACVDSSMCASSTNVTTPHSTPKPPHPHHTQRSIDHVYKFNECYYARSVTQNTARVHEYTKCHVAKTTGPNPPVTNNSSNQKAAQQQQQHL